LKKKSVVKSIPIKDDSMNYLIIDAIQDIKGKNIVQLDLRSLDDAPADFFIICEGDSSTQVKAISENIGRKIKEKMGCIPIILKVWKGQNGSLWTILTL
jgi:ribosome-associated protein